MKKPCWRWREHGRVYLGRLRAGRREAVDVQAPQVGAVDLAVRDCDTPQLEEVATAAAGGRLVAVGGDQRGAGGVELLDAFVVGVRNVDIAAGIDGHAVRALELERPVAGRAPAAVHVLWAGVTDDGRERVDVVLLVGGHVDVAGGVGGGIAGQRRLAVQQRHRDGAFQRPRRRVDGDLVGRVFADQDDVGAGRVLARGDAERGGKAGPGRADRVAVGRIQHLDAVVAGVIDVEVAVQVGEVARVGEVAGGADAAGALAPEQRAGLRVGGDLVVAGVGHVDGAVGADVEAGRVHGGVAGRAAADLGGEGGQGDARVGDGAGERDGAARFGLDADLVGAGVGGVEGDRLGVRVGCVQGHLGPGRVDDRDREHGRGRRPGDGGADRGRPERRGCSCCTACRRPRRFRTGSWTRRARSSPTDWPRARQGRPRPRACPLPAFDPSSTPRLYAGTMDNCTLVSPHRRL